MAASTDSGHSDPDMATSSPLTLSDLHHLLSSSRRRCVIVTLAERKRDGDDGWIDLSDLAAVIATSDEIEQRTAYISLYQQHVPKLADHDVLEWDQQSPRQRVRAGENLDGVLNAHHAVLLTRGEYQ